MTSFKITVLLGGFFALASPQTKAQDSYAPYRKSWLEKAEQNKPALTYTIKQPIGIVKVEKDATAFQGWKAVTAGDMGNYMALHLIAKTAVLLSTLASTLQATVHLALKPAATPWMRHCA